MAFWGCQKDDNLKKQISDNKGFVADAEKHYPVLKGPIHRKPDAVYIPNSDFLQLH